MSEITEAANTVLQNGMGDKENPLYLSTLRVDAGAFAALHPDIERDAETVTILRSVLMKPEHEAWVPQLNQALNRLAD
ncbi:hypothetical protein [Amycolatopsis echigonensis]|nr:hypothetical protein [Amycolatopsis niigatensis]